MKINIFKKIYIETYEIYKYIPFLISECPLAMDGMERFACPTPDRQGRYRCIDEHVLCDGFMDCPEAEDEDFKSCMFYKTVSIYLLDFLNFAGQNRNLLFN